MRSYGLGLLSFFIFSHSVIAQDKLIDQTRLSPDLAERPFGVTYASPKEQVPIQHIEGKFGTIELWQELTLVQIENAEQLKEALAWAKAELAKVREENPKAKVEVMVLTGAAGQKLPEVFPGNREAIEIGERVQWGRSLDYSNATGPRGKSMREFRTAEEILKKLGVAGEHGRISQLADARAYVGLVPENTQREDKVLAITRGVSTMGTVTFGIAYGAMNLVVPALLPAFVGGVIATWFAVKHIELAEWVVEKGWLTKWALDRGIKFPIGEKPAVIVEYLLREYSLLTLFYGSIEFASGLTGLRSNILGQIFSSHFLTGFLEFAKGPLYYSAVAMLSEGVASITLDHLTWELMSRNPEYRADIAKLSKRVVLFIDLTATLGMILSMFGTPLGTPILFALGGSSLIIFAASYVEKLMVLMERAILSRVKVRYSNDERSDRLQSVKDRRARSRQEADWMGMSCGQLLAI